MELNTRFINVDLDIKSNEDLSPLLEALGRQVVALHNGRIGRRYWIRVELSTRQPRSPAGAIRRFCRLVEKLPPLPRKLWKNASTREFDIGIQAGTESSAGEWMLDAATVRDVARVGARIELTIYSPVVKTIGRNRIPRWRSQN